VYTVQYDAIKREQQQAALKAAAQRQDKQPLSPLFTVGATHWSGQFSLPVIVHLFYYIRPDEVCGSTCVDCSSNGCAGTRQEAHSSTADRPAEVMEVCH